MSHVTRILGAIEQGDPSAAEHLLPLVYDELRQLAAQRLAQEKPGQTLQATALVHEAYLRLVDTEQVQQWNSRGHFFTAAAEAMRRILVESARRKQRLRHGGGPASSRGRAALAFQLAQSPKLVPTRRAGIEVRVPFFAFRRRLADERGAEEIKDLRPVGGYTHRLCS